jgi:DNA-directed RNA polymerase II subunit RPB2
MVNSARQIALDFIGRRGNTPTISRDRRIRYAQEIIQKELLPHIAMEEGNEGRKAYFVGYMIHRLLLAALDRREIDDRDHFGKKRLDLAGPLLSTLFRMLFRKVVKDVYRYLQKVRHCLQQHNIQLTVVVCGRG